ncbi:hypothetical protein [Nitratireductor luteus]|uniref:hypothetical protein n=1 Tax=Nitratireductor luteus TaxID=2976980 RepID=UPI00223EEEAF|nr:hypothetical protein [Nitratireductor luteus]
MIAFLLAASMILIDSFHAHAGNSSAGLHTAETHDIFLGTGIALTVGFGDTGAVGTRFAEILARSGSLRWPQPAKGTRG